MSKLRVLRQTFQNKLLRAGAKIVLGSDATGDIYYRDSNGLFTRLGVGSAGQILQVSGGLPAWVTPAAGGDFTWKVKAAIESVTSSNTPQDDDDLFFTATANKAYGVLLGLNISTGNSISNGFVGRVIVPSLAGGLDSVVARGNVFIDSNYGYPYEPLFPFQTAVFGACTNLGLGGIADTAPGGFFFVAQFKVGSTGGTVKLQWSQWSANATATKLHNGSFLAYKQLD